MAHPPAVHAHGLRATETFRNVPGDLVFNEWDRGAIGLAEEERDRTLVVREHRHIADTTNPVPTKGLPS